MKKMINCAFVYAIAAMVCGVFFREFTKFNGFTGVTALGKVHTHLFILGMLLSMVVALFAAHSTLIGQKQFKIFFVLYNIGVPITAIMMTVRGVLQVLTVELSKALDASISGLSGIGHILTGLGIIFLLLALKKTIVKSPVKLGA